MNDPRLDLAAELIDAVDAETRADAAIEAARDALDEAERHRAAAHRHRQEVTNKLVDAGVLWRKNLTAILDEVPQ